MHVAPPLDPRTRSAILDCCVFLLEHPVPWPVAVVLRWYKRHLERGVPVFTRGR